MTFDAPEPAEPAASPAPTPPEEVPWTPEIVFSSPPGPRAPAHAREPRPGRPRAGAHAAPRRTRAGGGSGRHGDTGHARTGRAHPARRARARPRPARPAARPADGGGGGGAPDPAADLTDEQAAVYARLREWRNAEAKRQEVSRFIIASNATLAEIARRVPYTLDDLRAVRGMGPERLRKYGEKILEVVRG